MGKIKYTEEQIDFVKNLVEQEENVTPPTMIMYLHFDIKYKEV